MPVGLLATNFSDTYRYRIEKRNIINFSNKKIDIIIKKAEFKEMPINISALVVNKAIKNKMQ